MRLESFILAVALVVAASSWAAVPPKKPRVVGLGGVKQVPYSKSGDPAGALLDEKTLKTRALLVDGRVSEWTTGEAHDITDRSFVVRRALRINDALPGDAKQASHWVWQRGPWLMIDRMTGRVTALKLPEYDPGVSLVAWFRDYAAYCGVTATGKSLHAVVAQVGLRKPLLAKKLGAYDAENRSSPVCTAPEWQREPLRISFHPAGKADPVSFDLAGGSAVLVEGGEEEPDATAKSANSAKPASESPE